MIDVEYNEEGKIVDVVYKGKSIPFRKPETRVIAITGKYVFKFDNPLSPALHVNSWVYTQSHAEYVFWTKLLQDRDRHYFTKTLAYIPKYRCVVQERTDFVMMRSVRADTDIPEDKISEADSTILNLACKYWLTDVGLHSNAGIRLDSMEPVIYDYAGNFL